MLYIYTLYIIHHRAHLKRYRYITVLQGINFFHGVKFSVQTFSLGKTPYLVNELLKTFTSLLMPKNTKPSGRLSKVGETVNFVSI